MQVAERRGSDRATGGGVCSFGEIPEHLDKTSRVSRQITTRVPDGMRPRPERPCAIEHSRNGNPSHVEPDRRRNNRNTVAGFDECNQRLRRSALEHNVQIGLPALARLLEELPRLEFRMPRSAAVRERGRRY